MTSLSLSLATLPRELIARIGCDLDTASRNACAEASRKLWCIHDSFEAHYLTIRSTDKLTRIACVVRHLLALKPFLKKLELHFYDFDAWPNTVPASGLHDALNALDAVEVTAHFCECGPAFVKSVSSTETIARKCIMYYRFRLNAAELVQDALRSLGGGPVASVRLPVGVFNQIHASAFDAVEMVIIEVSVADALDNPTVDLRGIRGKVTLHEHVASCSVLGVEKLHTIAQLVTRPLIRNGLFGSLAQGDARNLDTLVVCDRFENEDATWFQIASVLPTTVSYNVLALYPQCLRFVEHLERLGMASIFLMVDGLDSFYVARLVELLLKKKYKRSYVGESNLLAVYARDVARICVVGELLAKMSEPCQNNWIVAKYITG